MVQLPWYKGILEFNRVTQDDRNDWGKRNSSDLIEGVWMVGLNEIKVIFVADQWPFVAVI